MYGELPAVTLPSGESVPAVTIKIKNPQKTGYFRLPTSEEVISFFGKQKSIRVSLGRRKSRSEDIPNPQADEKLFNAIRLDKDGPAFSEAEMARVVLQIVACEVTDCLPGDGQYRIKVSSPFGDTEHVIGEPTVDDVDHYRKTVLSVIGLQHGRDELSFRMQPAIDLYDKYIREITGYPDGTSPTDVPARHKQVVAIELVQSAETPLDYGGDPNS